ncbi:MAG: hypothetical protein R3282_03640, partial [Rhodothermales bacterium]|nr:hypothetical protein [Rhodothermales bacterium]
MADSGHISVENHLESIQLGIVRVEGVDAGFRSAEFDQSLDQLIATRATGLEATEDAVRKAARDMLRNGRYKPTGRGKPASEYLLRAAADGSDFPRINWPVDVCSYISLSSLLPVSIWDLDRTNCERFQFRLGMPDEKYTFNAGGQEISLEDLVVGCESVDDALGRPIV